MSDDEPPRPFALYARGRCVAFAKAGTWEAQVLREAYVKLMRGDKDHGTFVSRGRFAVALPNGAVVRG